MIITEKIPWSFIKFSQLILKGNIWRSVWRICMWILGLKGLMQTCIDWIMAPIKWWRYFLSTQLKYWNIAIIWKYSALFHLVMEPSATPKKLIIAVSYFFIYKMVLLPTNFFPSSIFQKIQNVQKVWLTYQMAKRGWKLRCFKRHYEDHTFKRPRYTLLSTGNVQTSRSNGIITSSF